MLNESRIINTKCYLFENKLIYRTLIIIFWGNNDVSFECLFEIQRTNYMDLHLFAFSVLRNGIGHNVSSGSQVVTRVTLICGLWKCVMLVSMETSGRLIDILCSSYSSFQFLDMALDIKVWNQAIRSQQNIGVVIQFTCCDISNFVLWNSCICYSIAHASFKRIKSCTSNSNLKHFSFNLIIWSGK